MYSNICDILLSYSNIQIVLLYSKLIHKASVAAWPAACARAAERGRMRVTGCPEALV